VVGYFFVNNEQERRLNKIDESWRLTKAQPLQETSHAKEA